MSSSLPPSTSTYPCSTCHQVFDTSLQRDLHHQRLHDNRPVQQDDRAMDDATQSSIRNVTCRLCRCVFPNRSLLHIHRVRAHHNQVGGAELQQRPWTDDHNPFRDIADNNAVEDMYNDNDVYILSPNQFISPLKSIYNLPVNKRVSNTDVRTILESAYHHPNQGKAFKFNLAAGVIMENREDGSLRFFKPSTNMTLLPDPILVRDRASLQKAIEKLQEMDLDDLIRNYRINSKYVVRFITNLELYAYNTAFPLGDGTFTLPDYIRNNPYIRTQCTPGCRDELNEYCMFIALTHHHHPTARGWKIRVKDYYHQWNMFCQNNGHTTMCRDVSPAIELSDIVLFEQCFEVNVNIFQLNADNTALSIYKSTNHYAQVINLNLYGKHVNYITDLSRYCRSYACIYCESLFKSPFLLRRHQSGCNNKTRLKFTASFYQYKTTLFERLEQHGIKVPDSQRFYPFFVCYDFEAILQKLTVEEGKKLKFTHRHVPVSCSVASNVPGFTDPTCLINRDPTRLVEELFYLFDRIRAHALPLIHAKWARYVLMLQQKITNRADVLETENAQSTHHDDTRGDADDDSDGGDDDNSQVEDNAQRKREKMVAKLCRQDPYCDQLMQLEKEFLRYINQFVVLSFNGSRYDEMLIKQPLVKFLIEQEKSCSIYDQTVCAVNFNDDNVRNSPIRKYFGLHMNEQIFTRHSLCSQEMGRAHVIKRGNSYVSISNNFYNFLDVCQFLPPATSYDKFLRAYGIDMGKQYFCYEWMDDYDKLSEQLPPYPGEAWYSSLKDKDVLGEEYEQFVANGSNGTPPLTGQEKYDAIRRMWNENGWTSMKDLLCHYNNADVFPFVKAVSIMMMEYFRQGIDVFKIAVSIPGVSRYKMMQYASKSNTLFPLIAESDRDMYFLFKSQLCAGASLIITRLAQKGVTPIRAGSEKLVQSCIGLDANALYCAQQAQDMPSFAYVRRFRENNFKPVFNTRHYLMHVWLKYLADTEGWVIQSRSNLGREIKVGPYFLDGFVFTQNNERIAAEFYGCFHHSHINCPLNMNCKNIDRYIRTLEREEYLKKHNFRVVSIWECEFKRTMQENFELKQEYDKYKPEFYRTHPRAVTEECILNAIVNGVLYGFAVVDVRVPVHLRAKFDSFPPIFANHLVEKEHLSPLMSRHVKEQGINFNNGRRLLLTGMQAEEIMLSTKMIAWYIKHGLEVTNVSQVIEFVPSKPFKEFVEDITARRLEGARNPDKKIIAEIYKLMGCVCVYA